jgi:hypothetical protein
MVKFIECPKQSYYVDLIKHGIRNETVYELTFGLTDDDHNAKVVTSVVMDIPRAYALAQEISKFLSGYLEKSGENKP